MELAELTAYAKERYQISEQHKWADFPGFSVLCEPGSGKWLALLMRQWDTDSGRMIERCDLKCGGPRQTGLNRSYLTGPLRMHGPMWTGIVFDSRTEADVVFRLFDRAVIAEKRNAYTLTIDAVRLSAGTVYRDTPLPFAGSPYRAAPEALPERLREMRRLYVYGRETTEAKAANFYRQAVFMKDYEDDVPWEGDFVCYYPTYHEMTAKQLRGYFSWRSHVRKGIFAPIPESAAYLYIYELLNGIGGDSPEECLRKLQDFKAGYLDAGFAGVHMRQNLRRWMLEYAVVNGLPPETARQAADPALIRQDASLAVLLKAGEKSDEEVTEALFFFAGKTAKDSILLRNEPERGRHLFAGVWRKTASAYEKGGKDLLTLCFGRRTLRRWYPLSNAIVMKEEDPADRDYQLDECRSFRCRGGNWQVRAYEQQYLDRNLFRSLLHGTEQKLRLYLGTGRRLKEDPKDAWVLPYIDAVIRDDRLATEEAARQKITIDLSGLEQIRRDAITTRDSLLTEEDLPEAEEKDVPAEEATEETLPGIALDAVRVRILRELLAGGTAAEIMRLHHRLPSLEADAVNEALYDEIGDTVVLCEDDRLLLVDDYREELLQLIGGIS